MQEKKMGIHVLLDLFGCPEEKLKRAAEVKRICLKAVEDAGLSMIGNRFHQFRPHGATGFVLLAESHLSVHTWPEYRSASVDIFCCFLSKENTAKAEKKAEKACISLIKSFKPERREKKTMTR